MNDLIANVTTVIQAPVSKVWDALTNPEIIKKYMFGTVVISDWQINSNIFWKGIWEGKSYEDKGKIEKLEINKLLKYTHYSPLSGEEDKPENYHTVTIELQGDDKQTVINLSQDHNQTPEAKSHSEKNWNMMLDSMKKLLESH